MAADSDAFVEALRKEVVRNASNLRPEQVVMALFEITDEMWEGGIDTAWERARIKNRTASGVLFDITWLTMLASRLARLKRR